jgi:hypothetical protein
MVEVVAVAQVTLARRDLPGLRRRGDVGGHGGDRCFVLERRCTGGTHLRAERVGLVCAATARTEMLQLPLQVRRVLAGNSRGAERLLQPAEPGHLVPQVERRLHGRRFIVRRQSTSRRSG